MAKDFDATHPHGTQHGGAKDPVLAHDDAVRAQKIDETKQRELRRIEDEAKRGTEKADADDAAEKQLSPKDATRALMAEGKPNLTQQAIQGFLENRLAEISDDPAKARDLAAVRAKQMVVVKPPPAKPAGT